MMKAKRGYKEELQKQMKRAGLNPAAFSKEDKKAAEAFAKDMENAKLNKQHEEQMKEFMPFLTDTILAAKKTGRNVDFFNNMKAKLSTGVVLTDNMVAAIRKCMDKQAQWAKEREAKKDAPARSITLKVKPFIMKKLNIDSRIITGVVKAESKNAWLIEGHADMLENMSFCARCGRELTEPASQVTGFGAVCADKLGIPYDAAGVLGATKKKRAAIRKQYQQKLHNQKFECWIPKSQAEEFKSE